MYIRNDGKGESNITQNGFTAYLLSAVAHRKADYLHAKQRRQAREVLTDPDDLSTEESPGISDPTDLLCCIENAALEEVLNRISERDRYIFFSRALHGRSFHELALELDLGYQGVAAAYCAMTVSMHQRCCSTTALRCVIVNPFFMFSITSFPLFKCVVLRLRPQFP